MEKIGNKSHFLYVVLRTRNQENKTIIQQCLLKTEAATISILTNVVLLKKYNVYNII